MSYDEMKYDDPDMLPFKTDFNLLADLLIMVMVGSEEIKLKEPLKHTFDLYRQIQGFVETRNLDINLRTKSLGVPNGFMKENAKCQTIAEHNFKLQNSVFNFIYRLKCVGVKFEEQFNEIQQALNHGFMKNIDELEIWDGLPAEY